MDFDDIYTLFLILLLVLLGFFLFLLFYIEVSVLIHGNLGVECRFQSASTLKAVNSIEDIDTGLFSSGTIREKTLLFENGLVATFKSHQLRGVELVIGRKYGIERCTNNGGEIWYEIGSYYMRDANVR